jgi:hypothetical protein
MFRLKRINNDNMQLAFFCKHLSLKYGLAEQNKTFNNRLEKFTNYWAYI